MAGPYKCGTCVKSFLDSSGLRSHQRSSVHTSITPTSQDSNQHMLTHLLVSEDEMIEHNEGSDDSMKRSDDETTSSQFVYDLMIFIYIYIYIIYNT